MPITAEERQACIINGVDAETIYEALNSEEDEVDNDWYFTFGVDHIHGKANLAVHVRATYMVARLKMIAAFGKGWCAQYSADNWPAIQEKNGYELMELASA